ncbi:MAG: GNAT family N-acetyltransferase [Xanthobacteraceae bacterium]
MKDDSFRVRTMLPEEMTLTVDWAAAEGWNPGITDAACFAAAAPDGFLLGEFAGEPAAILSVVNYDELFSFLGFYIVRADLRGRGLGLRIWQAGMARAGSRTIGLDGVVAQQHNYRKSGFVLAYNNIRYGGWVAPQVEAIPTTVPLSEVPFDLIARDDAAVFPAARPAFLNTWIAAPGHVGRALIRDRRLVAWGVIRPCRTGRKIGPLIADDREAAEAVFAALVQPAGGQVFLDVPQPNGAAVAFATAQGFAAVFETARMYCGPIRPVSLERVYGVTTFELG